MTTQRVYGMRASTVDVYESAAAHIAEHGRGPSLDQLAERSGWSRPTVSRALSSLEEMGFLHRSYNNDCQGLTITAKPWPGDPT